MSKLKIDFSVLKGAIIVFAISLVFSGGLIWSSWYFKEKMLVEYNKNKAMQKSVTNNYVAIDEEKKLIRMYLPLFRDLHARGVLGQEQRLNWVETLRSTGKRLKLPALRYEIESQDLFSPDYQINTGSFIIYASPMSLRFELVHELDLIDVMNDLNRNAKGIYNLNSCNLSRAPSEVRTDELRPYVDADCKLMWFNIKKRDGSTIDL